MQRPVVVADNYLSFSLMNPTNVGSLFVSVGLDISPISQGIASLEGILTNSTRSFGFQFSNAISNSMGKSFQGFGSRLGTTLDAQGREMKGVGQRWGEAMGAGFIIGGRKVQLASRQLAAELSAPGGSIAARNAGANLGARVGGGIGNVANAVQRASFSSRGMVGLNGLANTQASQQRYDRMRMVQTNRAITAWSANLGANAGKAIDGALGATLGSSMGGVVGKVGNALGKGMAGAGRGMAWMGVAGKNIGNTMSGVMGTVMPIVGQAAGALLGEGLMAGFQLAVTSRLTIVKTILGGALNASIKAVFDYGQEQRATNKANYLFSKFPDRDETGKEVSAGESKALDNSAKKAIVEIATLSTKTRAEVSSLYLDLARTGNSKKEIVGGTTQAQREDGLLYNVTTLAEAADVADLNSVALQLNTLKKSFNTKSYSEIANGLLALQSSSLYPLERFKFAYQDSAPAASAAGVDYAKDYIPLLSTSFEMGTPEVGGTAVKNLLRFLTNPPSGKEGGFNQMNQAFKDKEGMGAYEAFTTPGKTIESFLKLDDMADYVLSSGKYTGSKVPGVDDPSSRYNTLSTAEQKMARSDLINNQWIGGNDSARQLLDFITQKYTKEDGTVDIQANRRSVERFSKFQDKGEDGKSSIQALFAIKNKGILGASELVSSSLDNVLAAVGEKLEPAATSFFSFFLEIFNKMTSGAESWLGPIERLSAKMAEFFDVTTTAGAARLEQFKNGFQNVFVTVGSIFERLVTKTLSFLSVGANVDSIFNKLTLLLASTVDGFLSLGNAIKLVLPLIGGAAEKFGFSSDKAAETEAGDDITNRSNLGDKKATATVNSAAEGEFITLGGQRIKSRGLETEAVTGVEVARMSWADGIRAAVTSNVQKTQVVGNLVSDGEQAGSRQLKRKNSDSEGVRGIDPFRLNPFKTEGTANARMGELIKQGYTNEEMQAILDTSFKKVSQSQVEGGALGKEAQTEAQAAKAAQKEPNKVYIVDSAGNVFVYDKNAKTFKGINQVEAQALAAFNSDPKNDKTVGQGIKEQLQGNKNSSTAINKNAFAGASIVSSYTDPASKATIDGKEVNVAKISDEERKVLDLILARDKQFSTYANSSGVEVKQDSKGVNKLFGANEQYGEEMDKAVRRQIDAVDLQVAAPSDKEGAQAFYGSQQFQDFATLLKLVGSDNYNPAGRAALDEKMKTSSEQYQLYYKVSQGDTSYKETLTDPKTGETTDKTNYLAVSEADLVKSQSMAGGISQENLVTLSQKNLDVLAKGDTSSKQFKELIIAISQGKIPKEALGELVKLLTDNYGKMPSEEKATPAGKAAKSRLGVISKAMAGSSPAGAKGGVDQAESDRISALRKETQADSLQEYNRLLLEKQKLELKSVELNEDLLLQQGAMSGYVNDTAAAFQDLANAQAAAGLNNKEQANQVKSQLAALERQKEKLTQSSSGGLSEGDLTYFAERKALLEGQLTTLDKQGDKEKKLFEARRRNQLERTTKEAGEKVQTTISRSLSEDPAAQAYSKYSSLTTQNENEMRELTQTVKALRDEYNELDTKAKNSEFGTNISRQLNKISAAIPLVMKLQKQMQQRFKEDFAISAKTQVVEVQLRLAEAMNQSTRFNTEIASATGSGGIGFKAQTQERQSSINSLPLEQLKRQLASDKSVLDAERAVSDATDSYNTSGGDPLALSAMEAANEQLDQYRKLALVEAQNYGREKQHLIDLQQEEAATFARSARGEIMSLISSLNSSPVFQLQGQISNLNTETIDQMQEAQYKLEALRTALGGMDAGSDQGKLVQQQIGNYERIIPRLEGLRTKAISRLQDNYKFEQQEILANGRIQEAQLGERNSQRKIDLAESIGDKGGSLTAKFDNFGLRQNQLDLDYQSKQIATRRGLRDAEENLSSAQDSAALYPDNPMNQEYIDSAYQALQQNIKMARLEQLDYIEEKKHLASMMKVEAIAATQSLQKEFESLLDSLSTGSEFGQLQATLRDVARTATETLKPMGEAITALQAQVDSLRATNPELASKLQSKLTYMSSNMGNLAELNRQKGENSEADYTRSQRAKTFSLVKDAVEAQMQPNKLLGEIGTSSGNGALSAQAAYFDTKNSIEMDTFETQVGIEDTNDTIGKQEQDIATAKNLGISSDKLATMYVQLNLLVQKREGLERKIVSVQKQGAVMLELQTQEYKKQRDLLLAQIELAKSQGAINTGNTAATLLQIQAGKLERTGTKQDTRVAAELRLMAEVNSLRAKRLELESKFRAEEVAARSAAESAIAAYGATNSVDAYDQMILKLQELKNLQNDRIQQNQVLDAQSEDTQAALKEQININGQLTQGVKGAAMDSFRGFFSDLVSGTKSFTQAMGDFFNSITERLANLGIDAIFEKWIEPLMYGKKKKAKEPVVEGADNSIGKETAQALALSEGVNRVDTGDGSLGVTAADVVGRASVYGATETEGYQPKTIDTPPEALSGGEITRLLAESGYETPAITKVAEQTYDNSVAQASAKGQETVQPAAKLEPGLTQVYADFAAKLKETELPATPDDQFKEVKDTVTGMPFKSTSVLPEAPEPIVATTVTIEAQNVYINDKLASGEGGTEGAGTTGATNDYKARMNNLVQKMDYSKRQSNLVEKMDYSARRGSLTEKLDYSGRQSSLLEKLDYSKRQSSLMGKLGLPGGEFGTSNADFGGMMATGMPQLGGAAGGGGFNMMSMMPALVGLLPLLMGKGKKGGMMGALMGLLPLVMSFAGGFAEGGVVPGGFSTVDDTLALLQRGEGVVTHKGMGILGSKGLGALNLGKPVDLPKFADGGVAGGMYVPSLPSAPKSGLTSATPAVQADNGSLNPAQAPGANPGVIDVRYESVMIAGQEYVTPQQLQMATKQAAQRGAEIALGKLQNSPNTRSALGMR